ncbi:hypothetical protein [Xanthomonas maliensis]|uniref:hypothetical protein n=1 Tax=Xanthomonas maliensis TaxID=1321368 RepID=UPI00039A019D|nr:hypothetical protein [Xanthomonas maliensis]KAB7765855.1 hypothetical protein CKY51_14780 [Xanthomonas maliensis]
MYESFKQGAPAELWQALVREAGQRIARPLDESREHYLVFVLLRFQRDAHLLSRTQALAWLHAQEQVGSVRADALRDVGDGCLLIAGLFPGVAQRRRLSLDYFIDLGRGAYAEVADTRCSDAGLFADLASSYRELVRTLAALRPPRTWQSGAGGILHA